ncbi:right-handed parallel beta-helix repeat-containing protein [Verrucomicrobiales bacterium]|nr:right-handed parallel beta-helix repeat-containing protein [Verrucomicrobiales bacterium]
MKTAVALLTLCPLLASAELLQINLVDNFIDNGSLSGGTYAEDGNTWFTDLTGDGLGELILSEVTISEGDNDMDFFFGTSFTIDGTTFDTSYDLGVVFNTGFSADESLESDKTTFPIAFTPPGEFGPFGGLLEITVAPTPGGAEEARTIAFTRIIWDTTAVLESLPAETPRTIGETRQVGGSSQFSAVVENQVTNSADSGPGSLRAIVAAAAPGSIITFAVNEVILTSSAIEIQKPLTIDGGNFPENVTIRRDFNTPERFSLIAVISGDTNIFNSLTLTNGDNTAAGGAIESFNSQIEVNSCFIHSNSSEGRGAGIYCDGGSLTIDESSVVYNTATDDGGGIALLNSSIVARNTSISHNNAADLGGGIYADESSTIFLQHCTLFGNAAGTAFGGGAYSSFNSANLSVELRNSLFVNNTAMGTYDPTTGVGGTLTFSGFIDTEDTTGISPISNPLFALGGEVIFGAPNRGHRISPQAVSVIDQADTTFALLEDQRGYPRALADAAPDIGATEYFDERITAWQLDNFGPAAVSTPALESTLWGAFADPDNDGHVNLREFAHFSSPLSPDGSPISVAIDNFDGIDYPTLTYRQNSDFGLPGRSQFILQHLQPDGTFSPVSSVVELESKISQAFATFNLRPEQPLSEFGPSAIFRLIIGGD